MGAKYFPTELTPIEKGDKSDNVRVASPESVVIIFNPNALKKTKIVYNFGLSKCSRVNAEWNFLYPGKPTHMQSG